MKILFIHKNKLGEPSEPAMRYYPLIVAELGHHVFIAALSGGDNSAFRHKNIKVYEIDKTKSWLVSLIKIEKAERPDVVHVYLYSGCGLLPYILGFMRDVKFVLDIRSPLLRTGFLKVLHRLKNYFEPIGYDVIFTHGIESAWTQLGKKNGLKWLPPGVDLALVPKDLHIEPKTDTVVRLVYIGALHPLRNLCNMIVAVALTNKQLKMHLDIFGSGPDQQNIENCIAEYGLENIVTLKGLISREELFSELPQYDIGLSYIPHGLYDSAPALKTLEYLACGLPVVATNTAGNRMFIKHGTNGIIGNEDPESFSNGIIDLAKIYNSYDMKESCRASVQEFDWRRLTSDKLLPVYEELLGCH